MNIRWAVRKYFEHKYREQDPYGIMQKPTDTRYADMISLIEDIYFTRGLDVGCGEGMLSEILLAFCDTVEGIDISETAIARARSKYDGRSALSFYAADIAKASFDRKYDLVVCAEVLYYLNDRQIRKAIGKISQLLSPPGFLLVGNIKKISANRGFFRGTIGALDIMNLIMKTEAFEILKEKDRGGDIVALLFRPSSRP